MRRTVYFNADTLKAATAINTNVDDHYLENAIWEAHEINIQQVCGTKLYRKIANLIENGTISQPANADYKKLVDDYLVPMGIYYAWLNSITYIRFKSMNKGVQDQASDNSTSSDLKNVEFLRDDIRQKAEFFAQRAADYLLENNSLYPEYRGNNGRDQLRPISRPFKCSVVFDK